MKASANAFLQECEVLPSKTFIVCMVLLYWNFTLYLLQVLPETPLHTVISEHNARVSASELVPSLLLYKFHAPVDPFIEVLVKTLGSEPAWQELWSKLHTTLSQIK